MRQVVIAIALLIAGCAHTWEPVCRHKAMYAALVVGEQYPVRIVTGTTSTGRHAQAQTQLCYGWVWLGVDKYGHIWESGQDRFTPDRYYTTGEYYKELEEKWHYRDWSSCLSVQD